MAGKNQSQRIKLIDKYLRSGRKFSWEELQDKLINDLLLDNLSESTIKHDIIEMKRGFMGLEPAPIVNKDGRYFYEKDFNLFGSPIQDQETYVLMNALDILDQFPDFEHSKKVKEIVEKLKNVLDIADVDQSTSVIDFEKVEYPSAGKWIGKLYPYLKDREALMLQYQPYDLDSPYEVKVLPLLLKEFNGRWFLIGLELDMQVIHNYALDRIISHKEYYLDKSTLTIDFDAEERFNDVIGVTYTEVGPKDITFQCSDYLANYFKTKKIHHSQEELTDSKNLFKIYCHINKELIAKLLSYGEDLVVLEPDLLVDQMKEKVEKLGELYKK
ncbi:MAG: helix-turn-helix transcriptional regulator [Bacteroidota bacterium]